MDPEMPDAQDGQLPSRADAPLVDKRGSRMTRRVFLGGAAAAGLATVAGGSLLAAYAREQGVPVSVPWEGGADLQPSTNGSSSLRRVIFLHQSTGAELIKDGNVRGLLGRQAPCMRLWDYAYNPPSIAGLARGIIQRPALMPGYYYGLGDATGNRHGAVWHVANTDPDGLAWMFGQPITDPAANAISHLLQFDVIAFKSCFTIFPIQNEGQLERYKQGYRAVADVMARHPDKLFIPLTPPPLRASLCTPEQAARARQFAQWIMSEDFHGGRANVVTYDLFDALAAPDSGGSQANTLRQEYCRPDASDSHPNTLANRTVAAQWAPFLARTIERL